MSLPTQTRPVNTDCAALANNAEFQTYPAIVQRVLAARVSTPAELTYSLTELLPPSSMRGVEEAAALIGEGIRAGKTIAILGDYDADGATATALSVLAIRAMNGKVVHFNSNRFRHGYGLSEALVAEVCETLAFDISMTVDLGITDTEGADMLRDAGYTLIITDHHLPGDRLPNADAIVNPNQPGCNFASKHLCGVGVAFYTMLATCRYLQASGHFADGAAPNISDYLDLVAIGTIGDVMPMDYNNRVLVANGLARIRRGACRAGILDMLAHSRIDPAHMDGQDVAFEILPKLNAAGRMEDMATGVAWLLAENAVDARPLGKTLMALNQERKALAQTMSKEATRLWEDVRLGDERAIVLHQADWHAGIVGLIAGRLKDTYAMPVVVFAADVGNADLLKGSGRSITGVPLQAAFAALQCAQPERIVKSGGHAMAAGITIRKEHFTWFKNAFNAYVAYSPKRAEPIWTDGALASDDFSLATTDWFKKLAPWGKGFDEPLFEGVFEIDALRAFGKGGQHWKFSANIGDGRSLDFSVFFEELPATLDIGCRIHAVYQLRRSHFYSHPRIQPIVRQWATTNAPATY